MCGSVRKRVARRCWAVLSREMAHREKGTATDTRASKLQDSAKNRSLCKACSRAGRQLPLHELNEQVCVLFEKAGEEPRKKKADRPSPLEFRLLGAFLKHTRDPEKGVVDFADGVRVGVGFKLPRVPAVYLRKRKWRLKEQENPEAHLWQEPTWGADDKKYFSAGRAC